MDKKPELSEMELNAFKTVQEQIDEAVCKRINLSPQGAANFSLINKECKDQFFSGFQKELDSQFEFIQDFGRQFAMDHKDLFEKANVHVTGLLNNVNEHNTSNMFTNDENSLIFQTGINWFNQNDYLKAFLYFSFLAVTNPKNANMWLLKGITEQNLGKNEEALKSYNVALSIEPENLMAQVNIIGCLILLNYPDAAKKSYEIFKAIDPLLYDSDEDLKARLAVIEEQLNAA